MAAAALSFVGGYLARWLHCRRKKCTPVTTRGVVSNRINELRCACGLRFWIRRRWAR